MASSYRMTPLRRFVNALSGALTRLALAGRRADILSVRGRNSGRRCSTPADLVIDDRARWLVAPYGERAWVKNARATGEVQLTRGRSTTTYRIAEMPADRAAPVLRAYLRTTPVTRASFGVKSDDPIEAFVVADAHAHPVSSPDRGRAGMKARTRTARPTCCGCETSPAPSPTAREVLVRVRAAGVDQACGT